MGASEGDLAPIDEKRLRFAAERYISAAYGYSGNDKDAYNQGVGATVVWPDFFDSEGSSETERYAKQVEESGTKSGAVLTEFEPEEVSADRATAYAYFETGSGYTKDGGLAGTETSLPAEDGPRQDRGHLESFGSREHRGGELNMISATLYYTHFICRCQAMADVPVRGVGGAGRAVSGPGRLRSLFFGRRGLAGYRDGAAGVGLMIAILIKGSAATNADRHALAAQVAERVFAGMFLILLGWFIYDKIVAWTPL